MMENTSGAMWRSIEVTEEERAKSVSHQHGDKLGQLSIGARSTDD